MREPQKRRVCHTIQLLMNRRCDRRVRVTMNVGPDTAIPIQILISMLIGQRTALARDQNQWVMILRTPSLHGREGMPKMALFELEQISHFRLSSPSLSTSITNTPAIPCRPVASNHATG